MEETYCFVLIEGYVNCDALGIVHELHETPCGIDATDPKDIDHQQLFVRMTAGELRDSE